MLLQLEYAGILARQRAILLGAFTGCVPPGDKPAQDYPLAEVITALRRRFAGPVLTGLPFGHVRDKVALPFGASAELCLRERDWQLRLAPFARASADVS